MMIAVELEAVPAGAGNICTSANGAWLSVVNVSGDGHVQGVAVELEEPLECVGGGGIICNQQSEQQGPPKGMQLQQAPRVPVRGRGQVKRKSINRSRSINNNKVKDSMTQPVLTKWSDLFVRRASQIDLSRVDPEGETTVTTPPAIFPPVFPSSPQSDQSPASLPEAEPSSQWGDPLVPIEEGKVMRCVYQNVAHSMSVRGADPGLPNLVDNWRQAQCGVALCSETNTNWRRHSYVHDVRRILQEANTVHISTASSSMGDDSEFKNKRFLPGGTAIFTFNHWACTVVESGQDALECGWFCYTTLQGRNKQRLTYACFYRSNKPSSASGPTTAHAQAIRVLEQEKIRLGDPKRVLSPREEIVKHIDRKVNEWQQRGDSILLVGDGNETPKDCELKDSTRQFSMKWLFESTGLTDVLRIFHGTPPQTTTTTPGRPIDWIGAWRVPILRTGSFDENFPAISDHLGFYVDIDIAGLMSGAYDNLKLPKLRKLIMKNLPARNAYEVFILQQWQEHRIAERAQELYEKALWGTFTSADMLFLNKLDAQITEILLGAEKRCSSKVAERDEWSPRIKIGGRNILYWRARLHSILNSSSRSKLSLERYRKRANISQEEHVHVLSKNGIKQKLREAWRLHRIQQSQAELSRQQHLQDRATELSERQHSKPAKAVKAIKHQEATRQRFRRIRRATGKLKRGLIQIEIKDPTTGELTMLTEKDKINEALLARNELHLQEPNFTPFGTLGDMYQMVDPSNPNNQVNELLEGRAVLPESCNNDDEIQQWVRNLQRKEIEEIDLTVSSEDFVRYFSRRKEGTASSPSNRHYGHMKVLAQMEDSSVRDTILRVAATAVAAKQPLDRWLRCTQVMLDKGKGVFINNLRIIQLLEADLNFILGFIWSKRLNQAATKAGLFNTSQYALPGKTCNSAVLKKVLFFDLLRQSQQAGSIVDFDAKAAYDSLIPALATVTCMRMGLPRGAGDFMTQLINNMNYSVATGLGESTNTYSAGANPFFKCQGGMQGSTSAAPSYNIHHDVSLTTYCEHGTPAIFQHPNPVEGITEDYAAQFVDDNQQQKSILGLLKHNEAEFQQCQNATEVHALLVRVTNEDANRWCKYSFCAGGLINASKCFWQLIQPKQCSNTGKITYANEIECPGEVTLKHPDDAEIVDVIPRFASDVANRTLGARLAPDGNVREEVKSRYEKAKQWSMSLRRAQLSNTDRWVAFNSCVRPAVVYPLIGQQCTVEDLTKTQGVMDQIACHALGLNEHFPRALLHGPVTLGGVGIPTLWAETLADKLSYFVYHMRVADDVGQQLKVSTAITQLELGVGTPFFQLPYDTWGHLSTPSWVRHLWQSCSRTNVDVQAAAGVHWIPPLQTESDLYIMELVMKRFSRKASIKLNHCRRYLQLVTVSDLYLHDGRCIHPDLYRGKRASGRLPQYAWPDISPPSKSCWTLWKQFLRSEFVTSKHINAAEDVWCALPTYSYDLQFRFDAQSGVLFGGDGSSWWRHEKKSAPRLRGVLAKCQLQGTVSEEEPPDTSVWVEVEVTTDAIIVLAESLREAAAMRQLTDIDSVVDPTEPISLVSRIHALPPELRRVVGKITFPEDDGQELLDALRRGDRLYGVSDGSASRGAATHGWKLTRRPNDPAAIRGSGPVDGHLPTSFRAEMQGQLAVLIVSSLLVAARGIPRARIISLCDNKATLRRLAEHSKSLRVRDQLDSEVDLFLIYRTWMKKNHVQCTHRWVKGHQDRTKSLHEIDDEGLLNIEVDKLATKAYGHNNGGHTEPLCTVFPEEVYSVSIDGSKVTSKIKQRVIDKCGEDAMVKYLLHKHQLSEGKLEGVNWVALAGYLKSMSPPLRASQVKLQHNWIPTNSFLFHQRRVQCDKCPLCTSAVETASHVRCCTAPAMQTYRRARLAKLVRDLQGINTAPEIVRCWHEHIASVCGEHSNDEDKFFYGISDIQTLLGTARRHQSLLSWESLLQGRASIHWSAVQASHARWRRQETNSHRQDTPWDIRAVRLVCDFNSDLWKFRNEEVHGHTQQEARQKLRDSVEATVRNLYDRYPVLLARYPSVHSIPLEVRLTKPTLVLQMWIKQVLQQEQLTDIARQRALMHGGSIERFLLPRIVIRRQRRMAGDPHFRAAVNKIACWLQRMVGFRSKMELPRMGIGDPG